MTNGHHIQTTTETVEPAPWADRLREIAPTLDIAADPHAIDELRDLREMIAARRSDLTTTTALDLADAVLSARDASEALIAMDTLILWTQDRRPLDIERNWESFKPDPLEWIIDGWLPAGRIGILSGQGGRGKSRLALQMASALAAGAPDFLGGPPTAYHTKRRIISMRHPATVVLASWEDDRHETARRLSALGSPHSDCDGAHDGGGPFIVRAEELADRLHHIDMAGEGAVWGPPPGVHTSSMATITPAGRRLRQYAEQAGAKLLILDPLAAAFSSNENDRGLVRAFLASWDRWGRHNDCAILVISHPPKASGAPYSGSTDWEAGPRFMWTLEYSTSRAGGSPDEPVPLLSCVKSNYGRIPPAIKLGICDKGVWSEAV